MNATKPRLLPHAVYQLFGADDELLYIGMTKNPKARFATHKYSKDWWPLVVRHEIEWYPTYREARVVETRLLRQHRPPRNPVIPEVDGSHITVKGGKPQPGRKIVSII